MVAVLYESTVRHNRTVPFKYGFAHRTYYWLVDIDNLPRLRWWMRPVISFPRDLRAQLGLTSDRVFLLTQAKVFGHVFNPISVYWCFKADQTLENVVAEVHNTYGGQHRYWLTPKADGLLRTSKSFYVSPFFEVDGEYQMRLPLPEELLRLRISLTRAGGRPFRASLTGHAVPMTAPKVLRFMVSAMLVAARIRYHGVRLYLRGLPVVPRPRRKAA